VDNILVVAGHYCCVGIRALMSFQDEVTSRLTLQLVYLHLLIGKPAMSKAEADFDQQCRHETVRRSLMNLPTYPWIEGRLKNQAISIDDGYYHFVDCTFEKWSLD
ncbi:carbonic anhydrase, partial [Striga asiatica]